VKDAALRDRPFDLLVVGGGIVGSAAAWDATQRGLRVALVEAGEWGGGTSANSLKTIHGGLRYLQRGDLAGLRESVRERRALLRIAPALVRPLSLLAPAYTQLELARLTVGLRLYDILSLDRNEAVPAERRLAGSRVLSAGPLSDLVPALVPAAASALAARPAVGGILWQDAQVESVEALVRAFVAAAESRGAVTASGARASALIVEDGRVVGASLREISSGREADIRAGVVLAAVGHELEPLLARSGLAGPSVPWLSAINLVLRCPPPAPIAIGGRARGRHLFLVPFRDTTVIGTDYAPAAGPSDERVRGFIGDALEAFPWFRITGEDVVQVHHGWVPGDHGQALWQHDRVFDHARFGAPGLLSAVAAKLTTARALAERAVDQVFRRLDRWVPPSRTALVPVAPLGYGATPADSSRDARAISI
jgi:glycerol-3-phosphate dehydrogenase